MRRLSRHTQVFELCARLGVNGLLSLLAVIALGRLVPHVQSQTLKLEAVNQSVDQLEASTSQLQTDFGRYFDPWQTEKIMQEQSGYRPSTERQVVWTQDDPSGTTAASEESAEEAENPVPDNTAAETPSASTGEDTVTPALDGSPTH